MRNVPHRSMHLNTWWPVWWCPLGSLCRLLEGHPCHWGQVLSVYTLAHFLFSLLSVRVNAISSWAPLCVVHTSAGSCVFTLPNDGHSPGSHHSVEGKYESKTYVRKWNLTQLSQEGNSDTRDNRDEPWSLILSKTEKTNTLWPRPLELNK